MRARTSALINFHRGWNAALDLVRQGLVNVPDQSLTPEQEELRNDVYDFLDDYSVDDRFLKPQPSNTELAKKYACSLRTIVNWRREGCPFDKGQWRVLDWLNERHCLPKNTKAKFAQQFVRRNPVLDDRARAKLLLKMAKLANLVGAF
jgi:hypothetical protein